MKAEILKILKKEKDYVSGQELCESLGVSRTAVWKAIRQLEEQGVCDRGSAQQRLPPCGGSRCAYSGRASFGP